MNMPTIAEIKKSMPKDKNDYDRWGNPAAYFCARPISYPITALFVSAGLSANFASLASITFALAAIITAATNFPAWAITTLILLWLVLDCVDGNIARFTRTGSLKGEFLDAIGGYIITAGLYVGIGYGSGEQSALLLGACASIFSILSRLILNKSNVLSGATRNPTGDTGSGWKAQWLLSIYNLSGIGLLLTYLALHFQAATESLALQATLGGIITIATAVSSWKNL